MRDQTKNRTGTGGRRRPATPLASLAMGLAAAVMLPLGVSAQDAEHEITLGALSVPGTNYGVMVGQVPDRIREATDGRVVVTINESILGASQLASGVRANRAPMSAPITSYLTAEDPRMGLYNLPDLMRNIAEYRYVCEAFWCEDTARLWEERWNSVRLAEGTWSPNQLWSKEPITSVEDFEGKTIRIHNPQAAALMAAVGASPTAMPMSEVLPALERGVIDGLFTGLDNGYAAEHWRVANNVQDWGVGAVTGWAVIINKDEWEALPEDLRDAIRDEMADFERDSALAHYDLARESMAGLREQANVNVNDIPTVEKERFLSPENLESAYEAWFERAEEVGFDGREYVERVRRILGRDIH